MPPVQRKRNLVYAATIVGCSIVYYFLAGLIIGGLLYVAVPGAWVASWPSRSSGVMSWFLLMNVLGCLLAAIPVAFAIVRISPEFRQLFALAVSMITATVVVGIIFDSDMSPLDHPGAAYWINCGALFLSFLLAVPLAVSLTARRRARLGPTRATPA